MPDAPLPEAFLRIPLAHRGLHDRAAGIIENSASAVQAAVDAGYGIEVDIQPSADGVPMVFHDDTLDRLTAETGPITAQSVAALAGINLSGSREGIPTLTQILKIVAGRTPLLIEIKDQDGALGPNIGTLSQAVAQTIEGAPGPIAVMSFNPHAIADIPAAIPTGLVTTAFEPTYWSHVPSDRRADLTEIPGAPTFISHNRAHLRSAPVDRLRAQGIPILTWTIRSPAEEAAAREVAHNITFEGYRPPHP